MHKWDAFWDADFGSHDIDANGNIINFDTTNLEGQIRSVVETWKVARTCDLRVMRAKAGFVSRAC